ncbi:MAG: competence/damage-inducible protein A [Candidatus Omnitrophica bacterium]|nr:competence/damage-inducible protein A [Candidatus Omnitrophota bacterium]
MKAEIICVGTEILLGKIVNTNAQYLSQKLAQLGIDVHYHSTVGDNTERLYLAIKRGLHRSNVIIITGGLGPTVDDLTLEGIAQVLQKKLILNRNILKDIKDHFHKRHIPMPKENVRQALVPEGAKALKNEVGTAPGLIIRWHEKKVLIALPGVPAEMKPMVERDVLPYLKKNFSGDWVILSRKIKTCGLAESQVNQKVKDILKSKPPLSVGIYVHTGSVDLDITVRSTNKAIAEKLLNNTERKINSRLKKYIYGKDSQTLESVVAKALTKAKRTIAVAESCTGGLISKRLTNISGSSKYFPLGVVTYSNKQKRNLLGIPKEALDNFGAVSKEVATLMAQNISQMAKTDMGLGITGIAGPTGASKEKPVGLVHIALATPRKVISEEFHFHGDRKAVRLRASQAALDMVRRYLIK